MPHGSSPLLPDLGQGAGGGAPAAPSAPPAGQVSAPAPPAPPGQQAPQLTPGGYPVNTPVADMTPEFQAAYWKHHARQHEASAKGRADYEAIKAERDQLKAASLPPEQQALERARQEGAEAARAEAVARYGTELVRTQFGALLTDPARGVADLARRQALIDGLSTGTYLNPDGTVKADALGVWADTIAPKVTAGTPGLPGQPGIPGRPAPGWPSFGQGQAPPAPASAAEAGRAEAARRFAKPATGN
jgi:hypothetical protein